ncbi:MAG: hypothetical protein GX037_03435 [Trueperella sp.]|nr:hypothetical protein [Trueperella sp.]
MASYTEWTETSAAYQAYLAASERCAKAFDTAVDESSYLAPTTAVDLTPEYAASDDRFPATGWMVEKETGVDEYTIVNLVRRGLILCGVKRSQLVPVAI